MKRQITSHILFFFLAQSPHLYGVAACAPMPSAVLAVLPDIDSVGPRFSAMEEKDIPRLERIVMDVNFSQSTFAEISPKEIQRLYDGRTSDLAEVRASDKYLVVVAKDAEGADLGFGVIFRPYDEFGYFPFKDYAAKGYLEISFAIDYQQWSQGHGTRVVQELVRRARQKKVPGLLATVDPRNIGAVAVLQKNGFRRIDRLSNDKRVSLILDIR